uniref:glutamine--tRNA ligase n=1 Tax=Dermatophagoides pteronyssinus TaxID=6956 RepID=A0A6P6XPY4_DERPT|nr:uncharacterized protein LOC113788663 [Dermatophagoides pteronyssinus]
MKNEINVAEYSNFITDIIEKDLKSGVVKSVKTRFPPEPNGYLHIGHAKALCLNQWIAQKYNGTCSLRFDDTNPLNENDEYINAILADVKWLGFECKDLVFNSSNYFDTLVSYAEKLIMKGLAYVDFQSEEAVRLNRGNIKEPGKNSPYRDTSVESNLKFFENMKKGLYKSGESILRAKIDMSAGNMNMRDPILYRIIDTPHPRTHSKWKIYPTYDFAHGQCDSIEGITHSICTLEFFNHRPLYNWLQKELEIRPSHQIEFARFNLTYTVMSKRKLLEIVNNNLVNGWDDPRMPTLSGMRRRGYPPEAIKTFVFKIGVSKREHLIQLDKLENIVRNCLENSPKVFALHKPVKVTISNYGEYEQLSQTSEAADLIKNFPKSIYIDASDFLLKLTPDWKRLSLGTSVRLKNLAIVVCDEVSLNWFLRLLLM